MRSGELTAVKTQTHATTNDRCSPAASVKRPASPPAKRGKRAFLAEDGTFACRIIIRHRTKNIAVASIGDPSRHLCAIGCQCFRLSACAIVDGDKVTHLGEFAHLKSAQLGRRDRGAPVDECQCD